MSVQTQLTDAEGELVPLRWGIWHIQCLFALHCHEVLGTELDDDDAIWKQRDVPLYPDEYTFQTGCVFQDPSDGEVFPVEPGFTLRCFR